LTGQRSQRPAITIHLDAFAELVQSTGRFHSLAELLEAASGEPIANKSAARQEFASAWNELWQWAATSSSSDARREAWLAQLRKSGWLRARCRGDHVLARQMLTDAFTVLDQLPVSGLPLPVFAATHLGDAHALDVQRDLGRLVCRAIAAHQGLPVPLKRRDIRRTWEAVGLVPDELSVTVLALNLPIGGDSLTDHMLRAHAALGEPCRLTFRHLRLHPPRFAPPADAPLFVCENPSIVASAAERLGVHCRPLVCLEGQPNLAAWKLLSLATASGWKLAYHGDFDWGGVRIANQLYEQFRFTPWRFDTTSYQAVRDDCRSLKPPPANALWDTELAGAMTAAGRALEEEQVVDQLLLDLDTRRSNS
jgi:uncharacterized protein (TIGR02679 family)